MFSALLPHPFLHPIEPTMTDAIKPIAARASLLCAAGYFDQNSDEDIPSPCISVCRMSEDKSHCLGCFRSIPEIKAWAQADRAKRLAIWVQLSKRAGVPFPPAKVEAAAVTLAAQQV